MLRSTPLHHVRKGIRHTLAVADGEKEPPRWVRRSTFFGMLLHVGCSTFGVTSAHHVIIAGIFVVRVIAILVSRERVRTREQVDAIEADAAAAEEGSL